MSIHPDNVSTRASLSIFLTIDNRMRPGESARQLALPHATASFNTFSGDNPLLIPHAKPATVASPLPTAERLLTSGARA